MSNAVALFERSYQPIPFCGCWLWTGADDAKKSGESYGRIYVDGHLERAHRFAYRSFVGPIPAGLQVLHRCDNTLCVNPAHLWLGTHADNMADKAKKCRAPGWTAKGEQCKQAKLRAEDIPVIRADPRSLTTIARDYGVAFTLISQVKNRKIWRHIP